MNLLKTIHGVFVDETSYNLWCKINKKKPAKQVQLEKKKETIKINDNYDFENRERKEVNK